MPFSLEGVTDTQAMVIQTFSQKQMKLAFHFLKNNKRFVVHVFTWKLKRWKTCSHYSKLDSCLILDFSDKISDNVKCDFKLYYELSQYVKDLQSSVNHHFPNDQFIMLQNHTSVKDTFKVQDRPMAFNIAEKFINFSFYTVANT